MADNEEEYERPRKVPKTLKEKDSGKRLIVVLEKASLETVKVSVEAHTTYKMLVIFWTKFDFIVRRHGMGVYLFN